MGLCNSCNAGCCRAFAVPVSGADILRIERDLSLTFWDFVCRWADPENQIAGNHAPHFHFADEPETPFVLCLTRDESTFASSGPKCRFLVECAPDEEHPQGTARCGIYQSRPATCRAFPTKLSENADLTVIYDVPTSVSAGEGNLVELCPRPWEPADIDPLETAPILVAAKYEMQFFNYIAQIWNRTPQAWAAFPEFLRQVYSQRVQHEPRQESEAHTIPFPITEPSSQDTLRKAA